MTRQAGEIDVLKCIISEDEGSETMGFLENKSRLLGSFPAQKDEAEYI